MANCQRHQGNEYQEVCCGALLWVVTKRQVVDDAGSQKIISTRRKAMGVCNSALLDHARGVQPHFSATWGEAEKIG